MSVVLFVFAGQADRAMLVALLAKVLVLLVFGPVEALKERVLLASVRVIKALPSSKDCGDWTNISLGGPANHDAISAP